MTVVTRFAPSPTGYLHIGGARTALFCWLYARHMGGKFLLRIEDTDRDRNNPAAVDALLDGLTWLGLSGDEPPVFQSQRAERHAVIADDLVKRGTAYRCYVTPEELEERRAKATAKMARLRELKKKLSSGDPNRPISFDGPEFENTSLDDLGESNVDKMSTAASTAAEIAKDIEATQAEVSELTKAFRSPYRDVDLAPPSPDAPSVIRLRMPDDGELTVHDKVQGAVTQKYRDLDDLVLLRSDGTPTYLLAVVVDDHDMGVTHVIRGDDHLTNTFRQIPIIDGMGWERPTYAHVPLIHGPDGKKLSKSHGATGVEAYRDELGYLPEGLKNYLLRLGWSHGDAEIISEEQAIAWFDLDGLNKAPARLDMKKLDAVNGHYMAQADDQRLFDLFVSRPEAKGLSPDVLGRIRAAMPALKTRSPNLVALAEQARFLTDLRPIPLAGKQADLVNDEARARLSGLVPRLEKLPEWTEPAIKEELAQYCAQLGIGIGKIGPVLRAVLTGGAPAPDITLVLALLGRNESVARIQDYAGVRG